VDQIYADYANITTIDANDVTISNDLTVLGLTDLQDVETENLYVKGTLTVDGESLFNSDVTVNADSSARLITNFITSGAILNPGQVEGQWTWTNSSTISMTGTAPITVRNITTGDTNTDGTITGQWTLTAGSSFEATFADLAEYYQGDEQYEPGTVVKIGGDAEVTQTTEAFDTEVFGVVSTNPAYTMNAGLDNGTPIALQGRVPVKVVGKVKKGERLVSSPTPGTAWALGDEVYDPRCVIGRSLQDKDDGEEGTVEAVIGVK
jgi:hypothetical protein